MSVEPVLFLTLFCLAAEKLLEYVEINPTLGENLPKHGLQMLDIFGHNVRRSSRRVVGRDFFKCLPSLTSGISEYFLDHGGVRALVPKSRAAQVSVS